ncbi:DNA-binding helix-turn-helix protein [Clostridiales bacterium 1_7_47FAA]|uniref:Helix-turn-helix domain-containing protein n=1 Tax=Enterocloster hominis (ex Hitch et al. 2024) TaxID=1917870 RepID=A0ABV1D5X0_9FIRM|nr:DNA-binding helix-turn-helix protein [Clostridiales bacterium 1_7_47FAA]
MDRSRAEFNVLEKITQERLARGWSEYTLAKNSGIAQSTISTWYRKNLQPSVASIEKICKGLDITLAQFFSYENQDNTLTTSQQDILEIWKYLNDSQKSILIRMIRAFLNLEYE